MHQAFFFFLNPVQIVFKFELWWLNQVLKCICLVKNGQKECYIFRLTIFWQHRVYFTMFESAFFRKFCVQAMWKKTLSDLTSVVARGNVFKDTLFGVVKYKSPENMKTHCHASNNLSWILGNLTKLKYLGQERYKNRYT